jgi:mannose-6-phosphate isomerase
MQLLDNPIQEYAWGSHTVLADFLGRPSPSERPQAELWIGAHPGAPSRLPSGEALGDHIAADPEATLGPDSVAAFGPRLPFLLKVLAVAEPLSLQVHPDREQAARGFAAETGPAGDPARNYKDDWPKPEILCALTDFHALCGLRDPGESAGRLSGVPALRPVTERLAAGDLRGAIETLLTWPPDSAKEVVAEVGAALPEPYASLATRHPGDMGVVVAALMNEVRLRPGQALYVPPRQPHAYLNGTGVELMAGSDNVLRAGLTPKHVDVPELLKIAAFEAAEPYVIASAHTGGEEVYEAPAREFRLSRLGGGTVLPAGGPQLLLCAEETVRLRRDGEEIPLRRGEAVFAGDRGGPIEVAGPGTVFRAALPVRT